MSAKADAAALARRIRALDVQVKGTPEPLRTALKAERRRLYLELVKLQDAPPKKAPTINKSAPDPELSRLGTQIAASTKTSALLAAERRLASASQTHSRAADAVSSSASTTKKSRQRVQVTSDEVRQRTTECRQLRLAVSAQQQALISHYLDRERYLTTRRLAGSKARAGRRTSVRLISGRADAEQFGAVHNNEREAR